MTTRFKFSENQTISTIGTTVGSTNALDLQAKDAPSLEGCIFEVSSGEAPLTFTGKGGFLQAFLQGSMDGNNWSNVRQLSVPLGITGAYPTGGALLRNRIPPMARQLRYLRLAYKTSDGLPASGATVSGTVTGVLRTALPDRFDYKPGAVDFADA